MLQPTLGRWSAGAGRSASTASIAVRTSPAVTGTSFLRGDANGDSQHDVGDAIFTLGVLFGTSPDPLPCPAAADANADGLNDIGDAIHTLGFRGEAIPSIASVSKFRLTTREPDSLTGTEIVINGGKVVSVKDCGEPPGTQIEVRSLFYNLPARRKVEAMTRAGSWWASGGIQTDKTAEGVKEFGPADG